MTENERLIDLIKNSGAFGKCGCHYNDVDRFCKKLADYLLANGVIIPPCKVGDRVYKVVPKCTARKEEAEKALEEMKKMIKPAQLYTEELKRLYCETWYDPKYIYYHSDIGTQELQFSDNNYERHSFAILENNEVVGYISYRVNWASKVAYNFGIISFKQSLVFGKDLMKIIDDIFMKYKMNKRVI